MKYFTLSLPYSYYVIFGWTPRLIKIILLLKQKIKNKDFDFFFHLNFKFFIIFRVSEFSFRIIMLFQIKIRYEDIHIQDKGVIENSVN